MAARFSRRAAVLLRCLVDMALSKSRGLLARRDLFHLLDAGVHGERARRGELAELVVHHVLGDEHRDELAPVVHREGVTDELGDDGGATRPGLDRLLLTGLVHLLDLLGEETIDERSLLEAAAHGSY